MNSSKLLITRELIVIPNTTSKIEAGREKTISIAKSFLKNNEEKTIVVVSQIDGNVDVPEINNIYKIGVLAEITSVEEKQNSSIINIKCLKKVTVSNIDLNKKDSYYCEYETIKESISSHNSKKIEELVPLLENAKISSVTKYIECFYSSSELVINKMLNQLFNELTSQNYFIYKHARFSFLEKNTIDEKIDCIISLLTVEQIPDSEKRIIETNINKKINETIVKQQKEFYLREKMKAIKDEIGKINPNENDLGAFRKRLESDPYPKHIKEKALAEIHKIETSGFPQENAISKNYVEWLINLPYWQKTNDNMNIVEVKELLDKSHFGLKQIKERIIEYIAMKNKSKTNKSPIICLVGPPGVGKTTLAISIAEALNKKFVKVSLGGVSDEAEIRGHRKTYIGAMPGRIIKAMKKAEVTNPLILLDEIDKMTSDFKGDPTSALLEVLDPSQNNIFSDNFLEEPYDLSNVMFIATANYPDKIPEPLMDRMEVIELTSYTENEKLSIAKNFLIKNILKSANISEKEFKFQNDDAITYLIRHFTREAGVRELERQLTKIARKFVVEQQTNSIENIIIDKKQIDKYLGKKIFDYTIKDKKNIPGVVNGMAYTSAGGDLLPIEVSYFKGKGNVTITGNLKDTMKESVQVALGYVKANAEKFNIPSTINFSDIDIHIHVPSGGVPKDGPSAGVTITTALISCFTNFAVPTNISMTGEITLRGKVGIIGGVKEKVISAFRGGITEIFMPKEDERYIEDIPKEIMENININFVEKYDDIFNKIFNN